MTTLPLRPFTRALAVFRAAGPAERFRDGAEGTYDSLHAYAFAPPSPGALPVATLMRQRNPFGHSADVLTDPKSLVRYFGGCEAVGTWNARGPGRWLAADGFIAVEAQLEQEQASGDEEGGYGDRVSVLLALWRVEDGFAAAVLHPSGSKILAEVMGLAAWPTDGWTPCTVWFGE